nr:unnamed protein product [Callosobruchus analis]
MYRAKPESPEDGFREIELLALEALEYDARLGIERNTVMFSYFYVLVDEVAHKTIFISMGGALEAFHYSVTNHAKQENDDRCTLDMKRYTKHNFCSSMPVFLERKDHQCKNIAMPRRKKSKCDDVEFENSHLEKIVESLAQSMAHMQTSISDLAVSIQSQNQNRIDQHDVGRSKGDVSSKQYISIWRDLGGGAVYFCPGGSLHPMQFLNKIERLFNDAGVPEEAKLFKTICCRLAMNKEQKLGCYDDFRRAFRERYWNAEHERALYYDLKYGEYTGGNRGDYLLKVAGSASYLSNLIPESDLVQMLVDHFPSEIKRGVVLNGIKNLDDFERYLRMLDGTYEEDRRRGGSRGVLGHRRDEGQNRGNTREIRYLTAFNAEPEALLSDPEEEVVEENFKSPVFRGIVNQLRDKGVLIPSLPISDVSVSVAVGGKKYRVKGQVLLSVEVESGGNENKRFTFLICVVIPQLNISVLFGSDWLVAAQVNLDFHRMLLSMPGVGFEIKIYFENNADGVLALNFISGQGSNRHKYTDSEFRQAVSKSDNLNDHDNRMADSLSRNPLPRITCSSPDMKNSANVALMNIVKQYRLIKENLSQIGRDQLEDEGLEKIIGVLKGERIKGVSAGKGTDLVQYPSVSYFGLFPEGNVTERANREIDRVLRALCAERHTKWAVYLDQIEDCLNNVVHESTGETPSLVNTFFKLPGSELPKPDLQCTWSLVHERLKSNAEKRKKKLNDITTEFRVGDAVLVRQHPISSAMDASIKKFFLLHEGPYWVSKVVVPNCYQVIDKDGVVIGRHNIKNLKKFVSFNALEQTWLYATTSIAIEVYKTAMNIGEICAIVNSMTQSNILPCATMFLGRKID